MTLLLWIGWQMFARPYRPLEGDRWTWMSQYWRAVAHNVVRLATDQNSILKAQCRVNAL